MRSIECVLALWQLGWLNTEAVVAWADEEILQAEVASPELMDLSLDGPTRCLMRTEFEFPARPAVLSYAQEFALRAVLTPPASDAAVLELANWMARRVMGEDLDLPEVALAYRVDHLLDDCGDPVAAVALVRSELPELEPRCKQLAEPFLKFVSPAEHPLNR